jgi:hypothetical protein
MREFVRSNLDIIEWVLGALAVILPSAAWLSRNDLSGLTLYDIFPPLGLIAFGLMWTHFVMGALRRYAQVDLKQGRLYTSISMGLVLGLILLHPGLFWLALYLDGYGLPPVSYMDVYATQLAFLALGTLSLLIFLAYELKRFFGDRKWWKVIERLQIVAMIAIFIHALGLGNELRLDWFMGVWVLYGVTLLASSWYTFMHEYKEETNGNQTI